MALDAILSLLECCTWCQCMQVGRSSIRWYSRWERTSTL